MKKILFFLLLALPAAFAQSPQIRADVLVADPADGLLGLSEISTSGLAVGAVAQVAGGTLIGDDGGGLFKWDGSSWAAFESVLNKEKIILVVGQSNVANGRVGGDMSTLDSVKVWNYLSDSNDTPAGAWEIWNKAIINPCQVSGSLIVPTGNLQNEERNSWPHGFAKHLARASGQVVRVIQSAQSGAGLDNWLTTANGGNQIMWDHMKGQLAAAGIPRVDFLLFDQGENSSGSVAYATAHPAFYNQLLADGIIDTQTVIIAREVASPTANNVVIRNTFETVHGNYGHVIDHEDLEFDDALHITGEAHDVVALRAFLWWSRSHGPRSAVPPLGFSLPEDGYIVVEGPTPLRIPSSLFVLTPSGLPGTAGFTGDASGFTDPTWTPDTGSLGNLTRTGVVPTVTSGFLVLDDLDTSLQGSGPWLPNSGDWFVGMRLKFEGAARLSGIFDQYPADRSDPERFFVRQNADGTVRMFVGETGFETASDYSSAGEIVLMAWRSGDDFYLKVDGETVTANLPGATIDASPFRLGKLSTSYTPNFSVKHLAVYPRTTSQAERDQIEAFLTLN